MDDDISDLINKQQPSKAVEKLISMPPALLESIIEDPKEMERLSRAWFGHGAHQVAMNFHNLTPAQKLQFLELLSRVGNVLPQKQAAPTGEGGGFSLTINLPTALGGNPQVIDIKGSKVIEDADV